MRFDLTLAARAAAYAALTVWLAVFLPSGPSAAAEGRPPARSADPTLNAVARRAPDVRAQPAYPDFRASLDETDELAALDAIHVALSQVGDGGSYVWHRHHGRLSGIFQPTMSFKDNGGKICRHLVIMLSSGAAVRRGEGIACRLSSGRWQLDG